MTFALTLTAIRRHLIGFVFTALIATVTAALLGVPVPLAISGWLIAGGLSFELWYVIEPIALERLGGCRAPTASEYTRIQSALGRINLEVLIAEDGHLTTFRGLRCLAIGRDLLEVLEDRALSGFLSQAAAPLQAANLAGFILVWLGNLPVLVAWWLTRCIGQLARLLALVVGTSLVIPLVVCRDAFLHWAGLAFTTMLVGLAGSILLSWGFAAAGLGLMLAWLIVPMIHGLLSWESRRIERCGDGFTIEAGLGPQLLEAIDFLAVIEAPRPSSGLLSVLSVPGSSMIDRARHIRRLLAPPTSAQ
jgi:hypothetical protein